VELNGCEEKKAKKSREDKSFNEQMKSFGREMEDLEERFDKAMEKHCEEFGSKKDEESNDFECEVETCCCGQKQGFLTPLIGAFIGLAFLILFTFVLEFIAFKSGLDFLRVIAVFIMDNLGLFFVAGIFFGYMDWFKKRACEAYRFFEPFVSSAGIVFGLWVAANVLQIIGAGLNNAQLFMISDFVLESTVLDNGFVLFVNLGWAFIGFALIGYISMLGSFFGNENKKNVKKHVKKMEEKKKPEGTIKRLYRSGNDKMLGGVCAGLAAYENMDPSLVRLLWIVATVITGFVPGIIAYAVAWIVIPQNPKHKWP